VLVIGDVMIDIIVKPEGPIERGTDTPATIRPSPGGSGANQAAWLAHFGNQVIFVARVGSNNYDEQESLLRSYGVEPVLAKDESAPTGMLITLLSSDGERSFLTDRGANVHLERGDLPDALLDRVAIVHVSGYALFEAGPRSAVLDFVDQAVARDILVTVDPSSVSSLREVGPQSFMEWTKAARICFPNAEEAAILAATSDPDEQIAILSKHYDMVVIKRGADGAEAVTEKGAKRWAAKAPRGKGIEGVEAVKVVDTTGAGDAFLAGFLSAYIRSGSIEECLERAVETGSKATTQLGGRPPAGATASGVRGGASSGRG
jgi:sugar/nucleoside kinase (ribokinase family)